jgi:uncharacterized protein (DUF1684 family)
MSELEHFRHMKDEFFRTDHHSPLLADQKRTFAGLNYFPENPDLDLQLEIEKFNEQEHVQIQTVMFEIDSEAVQLTIYTNEHGYFLPFADSLAGVETYGAGRYLEPERTEQGLLHINFNLAYNPYCAYNEVYSCPITPAENRIKVPIRAGEKVFDDEH